LFSLYSRLAQIFVTAFAYASAIFVLFSLFAVLTVRRAYIFGGVLITALVLSLFSLFFLSGEGVLASIIGLITGISYVICDTQVIIHKAENGVYDIFTDSKELFVDFIKIFIEIINILVKLSEKKNKKKDDQ